MVRRALITIGLICVLAISAAGCMTNGNAPKAAGAEPVTFTYFNFGSNKDITASDTVIGKELERQTGVDWRMLFLTGDPDTKSRVMIASGDYPDVIVPEGEMDKFLGAGAFIPLDDLIERYGPNIKRVYGPYMDKFRQADGKLYFLPFSADQGYISNPNITQGAFWIQRSVLKEFGYPKVVTLDQYFDLIREYKEKYPQVEGEPAIGFVTFAGTADSFYTIMNAGMHLAGYPNEGNVIVNTDTLEAKTYAATDIEKRWLKKLNEINALGLFDAETFTANQDQFLAKLTSGRVLGYFSYAWQAGEATNALSKAGVDDRQYAPLPIVFDETIKDQYLDPVSSFVNNRGIGISVKAKDPVRIIQYFDNLLKEENQILVQWGIEDQTYSVNADGRFTMSPQQIADRKDITFSRSFGWSYFEYSWPRYGNNSLLTDGNSYSVDAQPEVVQARYTEGDQAILDAYGATSFSDYFAEPEERPWYPAWSIKKESNSSEQLFEQASDALFMKYIPRLVLAKPEQFEALWEEYTAEYSKLGAADYERVITQIVKDRAAGNWQK